MRGKFIVIEGPDGSGKTSLLEALSVSLSTSKLGNVLLVPGISDSPIGRVVRRALSGATGGDHFSEIQIQALITADRLARYETIEDDLALGYHLLGDRWTMSAILYGTAHLDHHDAAWARRARTIVDMNTACHVPDLYIVLNAPLGCLMDRISQRSGTREIYENSETIRKIRSGYEDFTNTEYASQIGKVYVNIDATQPKSEVLAQARDAVHNLLSGAFE